MSGKQSENKVPIDWAASQLQIFMEALENDEDITEESYAALRLLGADVATATARNIHFLDKLETEISSMEAKKIYWKSKVDSCHKKLTTLKNLQSRVERRLVDAVLANDRVPFESKLGSIGVKKNPPKLALGIKTSEKTIRHIIGKEDIDWNDIDQKFLTRLELWSLNTDIIKEHLKTESLKWAKLEQENHLVVSP